MEVKKLLNPEKYDIPWHRRNWLNYKPVAYSGLHELLTGSFDIDTTVFDRFVNECHKRNWYLYWDKGDQLIENSRQDKDNLRQIKQALDRINEYEGISFKLTLNSGKGMPDNINITANEAIEQIYRVLMNLTADIDQKQPEKRPGAKLRLILNETTADIITLAYSLLLKHTKNDYSKSDKRFFTGLVLAAVNILELPDNYNDASYRDYKDYLIKKVEQNINAGKSLIKKGELDYSGDWYLQFTSLNHNWPEKRKDILYFNKEIIQKVIKELWG